MARVTPDDVTDLIPTTRNVLPFIAAASVLVTTYLGAAGLSAALLMEIERWWAAHLLASAEGSVASEQFGDTTVRYNVPKLGLGLAGTAFGQQVLLLDTTGILASTGLRRATIRVD